MNFRPLVYCYSVAIVFFLQVVIALFQISFVVPFWENFGFIHIIMINMNYRSTGRVSVEFIKIAFIAVLAHFKKNKSCIVVKMPLWIIHNLIYKNVIRRFVYGNISGYAAAFPPLRY